MPGLSESASPWLALGPVTSSTSQPAIPVDAAARLLALQGLQGALTSCRNETAALRRVVEAALALVPAARHAVIGAYSPDEEPHQLVVRASSSALLDGQRMPPPEPDVLARLDRGAPVLLGDLGQRPAPRPWSHIGARSLLLLPLPLLGRCGGLLIIASVADQALGEDELLVGQLLATVLQAWLTPSPASAALAAAAQEVAAAGAAARGVAASPGSLSGAQAAGRSDHARSVALERLLADDEQRIELLGADGRLLAASRRALDELGLPDEEAARGLDWRACWHEDSAPAIASALAQARAGRVGRFQARSANRVTGHGRGQWRWWTVSLLPVPQEGAAGPRLLALSEDVTSAREAAARAELTLEAGSIVGISVWDGGTLSVDSRFADALGLAVGPAWQEVPCDHVLDRVHPDDQAGLAALDRPPASLRGELRLSFRMRRSPAGGAWRWIEARGLLSVDEDGRLTRLTAVLTDIDARKRAELELVQNEQMLRRIAESLPILIVFVQPDLTYGFANRAYGHWFGKSVERLGGAPVRRLMGIAVEEEQRELLARALAGETIRFDQHVQHRDGSMRDLDINYMPRRRGDGQIDGCYVIGIDITSRKEEERALSRSNLSLEHTLSMVQQEREQVWHMARDLLFVSPADGRLRSINPAWAAILGWSETDLVGLHFTDLLHEDDLSRSRAALARIAQSGVMTNLENRWRCQDGGYRWLSWNAVLADGLIYGTGRDVTAEKEAAAKLQRVEEELRESQKMEAVGQLTGGIAHDFNNLLTGVIGSIEMMRNRMRQGRSGDMRRYMDAASGAAERAAALTHHLLAFSRRQTLSPRPLAPEGLVAQLDKPLRRLLSPLVELAIVCEAEPWMINCDPAQLEAALLSLASNGNDAMPQGGSLRLEVACATWADEEATAERLAGQFVAISVSDTGIGMSPEVMQRAFEPFFTTKPIGRGTGLGLSMVYGFARQSGGFTQIASQPGEGARVTIYLPRYMPPAAAARPALEGLLQGVLQGALPGVLAAPPPGTAALRPCVLLVEDEPMVRMLVAEVLGELGCEILQAENSAVGLRTAREASRLDLLITDVGLPGGMTGPQMAHAARQANPTLKVLFITGYNERQVFGEGFGDAATQVIEKPFAMEVLSERVRTMIGRAAS